MSYALEDTSGEAMAPVKGESAGAPPAIGAPKPYRITRSGARPLRFAGSELVMAMSFTPELPYWYEINMYRTSDLEFVAAVRLFHQSEDMPDTVEAMKFPSLEQALEMIEHYDAGCDVKFGMASELAPQSAPELAAQALELHARIGAARRHYRGLVGEILTELDAA
ncbi:MAG: hypothetical protein AAFY77_10630 [Pseudomonadota bacterium]